MRRVVVTGLGLVTPLGSDVETSWKNLIAGKSGAGFEQVGIAKYGAFAPIVGAFAFVFMFGLPGLFIHLVNKFQDIGRRGDKVVRNSLGWMYEPLRSGCEWHLGAEMVRVLLLTSWLGFLARSCAMRVLAAQLIAVAFTTLFLWSRPPVKILQKLFSTGKTWIIIVAPCSAVP